MIWYRYTFACDPDECDALLEITVKGDFTWKAHDGKVRMECPCGRLMNWLYRQQVEEGGTA